MQTAEERSKLVYRVRINVDNKEGILKQGMPVEAEIALAKQSRVVSLQSEWKPPSNSRTSSSDTARSRRSAACSFSVEKGEMFGLIGPDGAGKTTSIRAICGLLHVDDGTIRVLGKDPVKQHRDVTGTVGYLSQRFSLYGDLEHRREHRVLRRDPRCPRLRRAPRSPARDDAVDASSAAALPISCPAA